MKHVKWITYGEPALELNEIEDYLVTVEVYDKAAGALPPSYAYADQEWRTDEAYQGLAIVKGRCLHPDKLTALFDSNNALFDAYELKCKPRKKGKGYAASSRGDTSGRDFKLAIGAVKAGFDNQEIADLLIGCRAHNGNDFKRRDYYLRTIWRARQDAKADVPTLEEIMDGEQQQQEQQAEDEQTHQELLDSIPRSLRNAVAGRITDEELIAKTILARRYLTPNFFFTRRNKNPYSIILVSKVESDPPQYEFYISDGKKVVIDGTSSLFDADVVRQAFYDSGYLMPRHTGAHWSDEFIPLCFDATVSIDAPIGTTKEGELEEFVNEFCHKVRLIFKKEDLVESPGAPLKDGNRILIPVLAFLKWVKENYGVIWSQKEFEFSIALGYERKRIAKRRNSKCTMFMVPDDVIDINEIVDAQSLSNGSRKGSKRGDDYVN